jgi:hypothetical protein
MMRSISKYWRVSLGVGEIGQAVRCVVGRADVSQVFRPEMSEDEMLRVRQVSRFSLVGLEAFAKLFLKRKLSFPVSRMWQR